MRIVVLGAGMVGSTIAEDLSQEQGMSVKVVDRSQKVLEKVKAKAAVEGIQANLQDKGIISSIVADSDLVISAVPRYRTSSRRERMLWIYPSLARNLSCLTNWPSLKGLQR